MHCTCAKGYPDKYKKNIEIKNLLKIKNSKNNYLFHAGTNKKRKILFYWWKSFEFCKYFL